MFEFAALLILAIIVYILQDIRPTLVRLTLDYITPGKHRNGENFHELIARITTSQAVPVQQQSSYYNGSFGGRSRWNGIFDQFGNLQGRRTHR